MMAATDESESSRRRRAVYQALAPFLPRERLVQALWLWEEGYGRGAAFALNEFLQRICDTPELRALRSTLHLSLVKYMTRPLAQLGADPWPLMRSARVAETAPASSAAPVPPGARVFCELLGRFFDELGRLDASSLIRIRGALLDQLSRFGVNGAAADDLIGWLTRSGPIPSHPPAPASMRAILHHCYVLACEYYGPAPTDRALAVAVEDAAALPEATTFPPRQLL